MEREVDGRVGAGHMHHVRRGAPGHEAHPGGPSEDEELDRAHRRAERGERGACACAPGLFGSPMIHVLFRCLFRAFLF